MAEDIYENPRSISEERIEDDPEIVSEIERHVRMNPEESGTDATKQLDALDHVVLNIAITGESGVGKSTFINAIRGLIDGDSGSAKTGVTETTMSAVQYIHPSLPGVYFWDLPGIGTPRFKAKKYLKDVQLANFDFFIIMGSNRFKENDILLAKEIKKMRKNFYFVRSKIDQDIHAECRKKNFNEDKMLSKIRVNCRENLRDIGNPEVFLISTHDLGKYDFQKLLDTLKDNLSDHKWAALIQSVPVSSVSMLNEKAIQLKKRAIAVAAGAASTAVTPILLTCETPIMQSFLKSVSVSFGLDQPSIERLAKRLNKTEGELKSLMTSCFSTGVSRASVDTMIYSKARVTKIIQSILTATIPVGAVGVAFVSNIQLLRHGVDEMAKDARALMEVTGLA
ncbi:interferon-gamma-inducible GTPase 10-like [Genypterus blacodes]|uniref:interferon-gamma-inducible GTPase 10-like n=1 Tax=Genypterus blacodes TaxID=154954 RepID=UPI003F75BF9A